MIILLCHLLFFFFTKCHLRKIQEFRFVLHVKQGYTSMVRDGQGTVLNSLDDYIHCHIPTYSVILWIKYVNRYTDYKTNYLYQCIVLKNFYTLKPSTHIKINFKNTQTCFGPTGPSSGSTTPCNSTWYTNYKANYLHQCIVLKNFYTLKSSTPSSGSTTCSLMMV